MLLPRYELEADTSFEIFKFVSVGEKGKIVKIVQFFQISENLFNLGFGDKDEITGEISDIIVSNNGDSRKVLATVAEIIYVFTSKHPEAWIFATGSTKSRTRLYRIGISNNLDEILSDFELYGLFNDKPLAFARGVQYEGFFIRRRGKSYDKE